MVLLASCNEMSGKDANYHWPCVFILFFARSADCSRFQLLALSRALAVPWRVNFASAYSIMEFQLYQFFECSWLYYET